MLPASPTPPEARAALAEADEQARAVRRADARFRPILLVLAAFAVAIAILLGFVPVRGGWPYAGVVLLAIYLVAIVALVVLVQRGRARSRVNARRFNIAIAVFSLWNAAVVGVSTASGWWGGGVPGFHATVSFAVAALPLVVGAWLVGPPRR